MHEVGGLVGFIVSVLPKRSTFTTIVVQAPA